MSKESGEFGGHKMRPDYGKIAIPALAALLIGGPFLAAQIVGENDAKPRHNKVDVLPSVPPATDDASPTPTLSPSPTVKYPKLEARPTDIPSLGTLCQFNPMDPGEFRLGEEGTIIARVDTRCQGSDPNKAFTGGFDALERPNSATSESFKVYAGDIASVVCKEAVDDRTITDAMGSTSSAWVRADFYSPDFVNRGEGYVPEGMVGYLVANTSSELHNNLPLCGEKKVDVTYP